MDKKILSLAEKEKWDRITEILNKLDNDEVDQLIDSYALKGRGDPILLLRAILNSSPAKDVACLPRRLHLFLHCIDILQKNELQNKVASDLVGLLMLETDAFPGLCLAELATKFVESIKSNIVQSGKALELFPKILSALATQETISYGNTSMKGSEYKSHVLNTLCSGRWNSQNVIHLAAMFKDVPLTHEELQFVIEKVLRAFKDLDIQDLPALVYQLLLLSSKGHKKLVLDGVAGFFIEQDKHLKTQQQMNSEDDVIDTSYTDDSLRHTEGTIILHVTFAIKQDQELGREFIKYLKIGQQSCPTKVLSPFNLALALSVARIHRFEDQIFEFLKTTILKSFKDVEKQTGSQWVRDAVPESCSVKDLVLETVQNSKYGWDHVTQGLVQLGFLLMDAFGPKCVFGRIETSSLPTHSPSHSACTLGADILLTTFKVHEVVRSEILDQIFNRVITKATSPVSHYLNLLSQTVSATPQSLLDCLPKVREAFDYLAFLPLSSADSLLTAIQPLLKLSMSLKDALILVLRKSMFSKQVDARKIGLSGFLMLLKHFKVLGGLPSSQASQGSSSSSMSSSQVMVDIHIARLNPAGNEAFCLEILGNLRRCFTQQADIRLLLYQGLYEVLCRNAQLGGIILDMLLPQLKKYYEVTEDVIPPLKLEPCILAQENGVYLAEPLSHLIGCVQLCLLKCSLIGPDESGDHQEDGPSHSQSELEKMFESLTQRMIKCEMEDFELDKSADFTLANSVGQKNSLFAILVLGTYEALMEYNFIKGQYSHDSCQQVADLFANYHKLCDIVKDKATSGTGKKGRPGGRKTPCSLLSINCLHLILKSLYGDVLPDHQDGLKVLRDNADFCHYIVTMVTQKLQQVHDKGLCEGADKKKLFSYVCAIGRVLQKHYVDNQQVSRKERIKAVVGPCLEGMVLITSILSTQYPDKLNTALQKIEKTSECREDESLEDCVYSHIRRYQRLVMNILSSNEEEVNLKDVASLLSVIGCFCKHLPPGGEHFKQVHEWVKRLCVEQSIDDLGTCKLVFSHMLIMSRQIKSSLPLIRDIAQDIHTHLGDIDQEVEEVEDRTHFGLVSPKSAAPTILLLLLSQTDQELDDTEWVINLLRADYLSQSPSEECGPSPTQREGREKSICTRLGVLITAFHEIVQSAVPVGPCTETMVKQTSRLYTAITLLVKLYLTLCGQKSSPLSGRFEKLIKLSGTHLTQQVYAMITYIQASGNEHIKQTVDKEQKDKKKATAAVQAGKARVMKESKMIPNLIFAIEQYERYLIQLSKKSKFDFNCQVIKAVLLKYETILESVNLMEHMKHSTSRDFRINVAAVDTAMEESSSEEETEGDDPDETANQTHTEEVHVESDGSDENQEPDNEDGQKGEDSPPPAKKSKLGKLKKGAKSKTK